VLYPKLDISSLESIKAFACEVQQQGPVDVLINNAGVNLDAEYGYENAKKTLDVNYRGTLEVCLPPYLAFPMHHLHTSRDRKSVPYDSTND